MQYYSHAGEKLPYDPWQTHAITVDDLQACAKQQGVVFRQADILIIRVGFIQKYYLTTQEEKDRLQTTKESLWVYDVLVFELNTYSPTVIVASAGIEQSEEMKRFIWFIFSSVA